MREGQGEAGAGWNCEGQLWWREHEEVGCEELGGSLGLEEQQTERAAAVGSGSLRTWSPACVSERPSVTHRLLLAFTYEGAPGASPLFFPDSVGQGSVFRPITDGETEAWGH